MLLCGLFAIPAGCQLGGYQSLSDLLARHPSNRLKNWEALFLQRKGQKTLPDDFIQPAPQVALDYAIDLNEMDGFPAPETARMEAGQLEALKRSLDRALRSQPELENFLLKRIAGVYLVENLGSSGLTGIIYDESGKARAGFVLMDVNRIMMSAEDMINLREKTIIQNADDLPSYWGYRLTCGNQPCPGTIDGLTYLLFHEAAHVASEVHDLMPGILLSKEEYDPSKHSIEMPFRQHWKTPWQTGKEYSFRQHLKYYSTSPGLDRQSHSRAVQQAMNDGIPGLYATVDVWEHMAELVAYMMLRRTLEFRPDADATIVLDPQASAMNRSYLNRLKTIMDQDKGPEVMRGR